jgi:hypothetical protein
MNAITTKHKLDFLSAIWDIDPSWREFKIGTVTGLWRSIEYPISAYEILAFKNQEPNNGHLDDVFEWFEYSCKRDNRPLIILDVINTDFKSYLIRERGFWCYDKDSLIKYFL